MLNTLQHSLSYFFSKTFRRDGLRCLASTHGLEWGADEFNVLLFNENRQSLLRVELPGRSGPFQSWLLGFDLTQNQLLVDAVFPAPPVELLANLVHFKITLFCQQQVLTLQVRILEQLAIEGKPALVVQVLSKHYQQDRRALPRFGFERRNAPMARLQIPLHPQLRASVVNLSQGGCLLNLFGKPDFTLQDLKNPIRCQIALNATHQLDCLLQIKACEYFRSPCQHSQLRAHFVGLSAEQQSCLQQFIGSLETPNINCLTG